MPKPKGLSQIAVFSFVVFILLFVNSLMADAQVSIKLTSNDSLNIQKWSKLAADFERNNDPKEASRYFDNIGLLYWDHNFYLPAIQNFKKSISLNEKVNNQSGIAMLNNNIAMIYADLGDFANSAEYFNKTLAYRRSHHENIGIISGQINLSVVLNHLKRFDESVKGLEEALSLAREMNDLNQMKSCYGMLAETYERAGKPEKSLYYFNFYKTFHEQIIKKKEVQSQKKEDEANLRVSLVEAEKRYKELELSMKDKELLDVTEKKDTLMKSLTRKQLQIVVLNREKELRILAKNKEEERLKHEELRHRNQVVFAYILSLLLVLIIVIVFRSNLRRKKHNKILAEQHKEILIQKNLFEKANNELAIKNKDITESINYALRIQQSMMSSKLSFSDIFPESFVFYLPKNIISGDFYWYRQIDEDRALLAVVDCTGHGVPGAFMSVLGSSIIRQIVDQQKVYRPDEILHLMDLGVYESLNQNFTDIRDGMEAAVLLIDKKNKMISFSGAGLPLVYFENGEMSYVKGAARAIGGIRKLAEKEFVCKDIVLNGEVSLYLFSDGYADQYDSLGQKKFLIKNFRAFLNNVRDLSMDEQFGCLLDTFDQWKGKQKQTDDILVVGIKVCTD